MHCFDRFVNIEPSAVEEVVQDPNDVSGVGLSNSSLDEKILSTEVGSNIHTMEEESTKLRITNISEGEYGLRVGCQYHCHPVFVHFVGKNSSLKTSKFQNCSTVWCKYFFF